MTHHQPAATLGHHLISKTELIQDIKQAIASKSGYAAGKLGRTERLWMYYPIFLKTNPSPLQRKAFDQMLAYHGRVQSGIFPFDSDFMLRFSQFYIQQVQQMECLGIILDRPKMEGKLIDVYEIQSKLIYYKDQEPDRSSPANETACYLPHFRAQRLLLVCPFAEFLCERANQVTFEGVWSQTGKKWFYPKSVDWLAFPYGLDVQTQQSYSSALTLYDEIVTRLEKKEFDIALLAAGGLAIPLASHIKSLGKVAISLGGHLQVLFGVYGERWRNRGSWQRRYFNQWWADLPPHFHPAAQHVTDNGAYW